MSEFDGDQPVVTSFQLTRVWKTGHCVDRDEFAFVKLRIGECQVGAQLLRDGSLKLPGGVHIPAHLRKAAKEQAQHLALQELAESWSKQRDQGADGRYLDPGDR